MAEREKVLKEAEEVKELKETLREKCEVLKPLIKVGERQSLADYRNDVDNELLSLSWEQDQLLVRLPSSITPAALQGYVRLRARFHSLKSLQTLLSTS